jgi:hypothetical protein
MQLSMRLEQQGIADTVAHPALVETISDLDSRWAKGLYGWSTTRRGLHSYVFHRASGNVWVGTTWDADRVRVFAVSADNRQDAMLACEAFGNETEEAQ